MKLSDLLINEEIENLSFECKARIDRNNDLGWLKTIDGFANSHGGMMLLGVEDKTNNLIGYSLEDVDKEKLFIYEKIHEHFSIEPQLEITVMPYVVRDNKRYIIKIFVHESDVKPLIFKYQGMPLIFKRRDGYTSSATSEEIIQMSLNNKNPKFDQGLTAISFDKNEFKTLFNFYKEHTSKELKEKELASIGFFDDNKKLRNGALLFKDDYNEGRTTVVCSLYKGLTRGDDQIIASNTFNGNLIASYNFIYEFIEQRMNHGFIKTSTNRKEVDSFPSRSLLEAIINALAHRDYLLDGSSIYVDLFKNRLTISSPGSILGVEELKKTYDLESFISKRRNELISSVFVLCKVMESKGTGLEKIMSDYKDASDKHRPFIFSKNNQFSIVLPDLTSEIGVDIEMDSLRFLIPFEEGSKYDISILAFCYSKAKSIQEICDYLKISNSTFFRKNVLGNLLSQNLLEITKKGNASYLLTNHSYVSLK